MNSRARKKFWNTLCSLEEIDVKADEQKLVEAMQYPRHLYRFRPVSFSSLDALQSNKLYFSSADHYDDPFDSFLHIDIPRIENEVKDFFNARKSWDPHLDKLSDIFGIPKDQLGTYFSSLELEPSQNMVINILNKFWCKPAPMSWHNNEKGDIINFLVRLSTASVRSQSDVWIVC